MARVVYSLELRAQVVKESIETDNTTLVAKNKYRLLIDNFQIYSSLKLIEPLRVLRYIHFAVWISKR